MGKNISEALITGIERRKARMGEGVEARQRYPSVIDGTHPGLIKYPTNSTGGI